MELFDPLPSVNAELRPLIAGILPMLNRSISNPKDLSLARQAKSPATRAPAALPSISEQWIAGKADDPQVRIYVVNARPSEAPVPAILHIHGGGFILGSAKSDLADLQDLAAALNCVIVSVDYRLAPETPFPGPLDDCYAGLVWLHANAAELGIDPTRIAVKGESAGGGLAAMLAIAAHARDEVPLAFQCLVYPMLDDRTGSTVQRPRQQGALMWTRKSNRYGWTSFLGVPAGSRNVPAGAVPARAEDLRGLPPAFIG